MIRFYKEQSRDKAWGKPPILSHREAEQNEKLKSLIREFAVEPLPDQDKQYYIDVLAEIEKRSSHLSDDEIAALIREIVP